MDPLHEVAMRYDRFALDEVGDRSAVYADWARGVSADERVQGVLARIPASHRQPPLVFAVARMLGAPVGGYGPFADWVLAHADDLVAEGSRRSVQTNEPLRCAVLLPALARIGGPLALIELGASAGLCLYPDRYSYDLRGSAGVVRRDPVDGPSPVVLTAEVAGMDPAVVPLPDIVWRAGVDLAPLDVHDPADVAFLTGLAWPGEEGRAERIATAAAIAAADPPILVAGDATSPEVVAALLARVPRGATPVVMTPGLLPHIDRSGRQRLIATLREWGVEWVSIEPSWVRGGEGARGFVLMHGDELLARCDPLGGWWEWDTPEDTGEI